MNLPDISGLLPGTPGAFHAFGKHLLVGKDGLGWIPHAKQSAFGDSLAKVLLLICGIRFGKSDVLAARYLHAMTFTPGGSYLNTGPSQEQANIVVERAHMLAKSGPLIGMIDRYIKSPHPTLYFVNGAKLQARSSDDTDLLRGPAHHGVGVDEAALASQGDIDVLRGRLMDHAGWLALVSSPKGKDWLYASYVNAEGRQKNGDGRFFAATGTTWDNPIIPRDEIQRMKEDSSERWYRQEIMGEFMDLEGATFPREVLDKVFANGLALETSPIKGGIYVVAWDLGRKTTMSVGTVLECSTDTLRVVDVIRLSAAPWPVIYKAIEGAHAKWGAYTIIDGTGVGDVVYESVGVPVTPFIFTRKSRTGLITTLQSVAHKGGSLLIPRETTPDLYMDLLVHTWEEDAEGRTWDDLDSLMLAVHHARDITFRGPLMVRLQ